MKEWSRTEVEDCVITASLAESAAEAQVFSIRVARGDVELRREKIPLVYPVAFEPHYEDVATLDERIEEIIMELGLARDDAPKPS